MIYKHIVHSIIYSILFIPTDSAVPEKISEGILLCKKIFEYYGHIHEYYPRVGADQPMESNFFRILNFQSIFPFPASFALSMTSEQLYPFKCMGDLC